MINRKLIATVLCACGLLISTTTWAGTSFPGKGVDTAPSLARFILTFSKSFINTRPDELRDVLRERFCSGRIWTFDPDATYDTDAEWDTLGRWDAEPECTRTERTVTGPIMYQGRTEIGRSRPHYHGSTTDINRGAIICKDGTQNSCTYSFMERIVDNHFGDVPWGAEGRPTDFFNGPSVAQADYALSVNLNAHTEVVEEVHTQMISLELRPLWPDTYNNPPKWNSTQKEYESANRIRAGTMAPDQPISIGEVESLSSDGKGFPAESFFDMNVEIDLDFDNNGTVDFTLMTHSMVRETNPEDPQTDGISVGDQPLIVQGYNLQSFPPKVVYEHNATVWAVPMFNKAEVDLTNQVSLVDADWTVGFVGWLRLAGHGIDFGPNAQDKWEWDNRPIGTRKGMPIARSTRQQTKETALAKDIALFNNFVEKLAILPINPVEIQIVENEPPPCKLYVLQDHKRNGSQIFTIDPNSFEVEPMSKVYAGLDIEGLATLPSNDMIYGTSGNDSETPGYLYSFDAKNGKLTEIGATGFGDVPSIDFHSDGTLWGWVKGKGFLITIDPVTGKGTIVEKFPDSALVEDIVWNNAGTHIYASANTNLWVYERATKTTKLVCNNLPGETEALEMLPDGSLLLGIHGERKILLFKAINIETCNDVFDFYVPTDATINDVEGIAWPVNLCSQP